MKKIPATVQACAAQIQSIGSFSSWSAASTLSVEQIKPYCVPGNSAQAKGELAVWVRGPHAKRPRILIVTLVLRAMHFIAKSAQSKKYRDISARNFKLSLTDSETTFPGVVENGELYLALARRLLGLPDDSIETAAQKAGKNTSSSQGNVSPNIRTAQGLFIEVTLAYMEGRTREDVTVLDRDWVNFCYRILFHRHGAASWLKSQEEHLAELTAVLESIQTDPTHADIRDINIAKFAMLYANGLYLCRKIRASAITTVVNRIADAADDGLEKACEQDIERIRAQSTGGWNEILRQLRFHADEDVDH